jgi:hypothetical protein
MQERRASRRFPVSLKATATLQDTQKTYEGKVTDISFSGVRFVCAEEIAKDQNIELHLFIEDEDVKLRAVVVWASELEGLEDFQHGMKVVGVAFVGDSKKLDEFFKKIKS